MKKRLKKLTIHRETLQRMTPQRMEEVQGGALTVPTRICPGPSYQDPCATWEPVDSACRVC